MAKYVNLVGAGGDGMSAYLEAQKKRGKKTDARTLKRVANMRASTTSSLPKASSKRFPLKPLTSRARGSYNLKSERVHFKFELQRSEMSQAMGGDSYGDYEETKDELLDTGWRCSAGVCISL